MVLCNCEISMVLFELFVLFILFSIRGMHVILALFFANSSAQVILNSTSISCLLWLTLMFWIHLLFWHSLWCVWFVCSPRCKYLIVVFKTEFCIIFVNDPNCWFLLCSNSNFLVCLYVSISRIWILLCNTVSCWFSLF